MAHIEREKFKDLSGWRRI